MNDESIREAFRYGAGEAEPGAGMWERIEHETRVRGRTGVWRALKKTALAAGVLLILGAGVVALSPTVRATVVKTVSSLIILWEGRVGKTDGVLRWSNGTKEQLEQQGVHFIAESWTRLADTGEAARMLGFAPAEAHGDPAKLLRVEARLVPWGDHEVRMAQLEYRIDGVPASYFVGTVADGAIENGVWVHRPYEGVEGFVTSPNPPSDPQTIDLGNLSALCYNLWDATTACTFLQDGRSVSVMGPDRDVVIRLAKSAAGTP